MRRAAPVTSLLLRALMMGLARAQAQALRLRQQRTVLARPTEQRFQAYVVLLCLCWDIYAKWKETGVGPDDAEANKAL